MLNELILEISITGDASQWKVLAHSNNNQAVGCLRKIDFPFDVAHLVSTATTPQDWLRVTTADNPVEQLQEFGAMLFNSIIRDNIKHFYNSARQRGPSGGLFRILLNLPLELAALPWEFLYDAENNIWLAAASNMILARIVKKSTIRVDAQSRGPIKVTAVVANPVSDHTHYHLFEAYRKDLHTLLKRTGSPHRPIRPHIIHGHDIAGQFRRHFKPRNKIDLLHVFAHVERDPMGAQQISVEDMDGHTHQLDSTMLSNYVGDQNILSVLICGHRTARSNSKHWFSNLAVALVHAGTRAVVGMQFDIDMQDATTFALSSLGHFLDGTSLERALKNARVELRATSLLAWGGPILHVHSTWAAEQVLGEWNGEVRARITRSNVSRFLERFTSDPEVVVDCLQHRRAELEAPSALTKNFVPSSLAIVPGRWDQAEDAWELLCKPVHTFVFGSAGMGKTRCRRQLELWADQHSSQRILVVTFTEFSQFRGGVPSIEDFKHIIAQSVRERLTSYGESQASDEEYATYRRASFQKLLEVLLGLVGEHGFEQVYFCFDCETDLGFSRQHSDVLGTIIHSLGDDSLSLPKQFVFKFFLPRAYQEHIPKHVIREHAGGVALELRWLPQILRELLDSRLDIDSFDSMCEDSSEAISLIVEAAHGSPRRLLEILDSILKKHCRRPANVAQLIKTATIRQVLNEWSLESYDE